VPIEVRRRLGVGPGSVLEWKEDGQNLIVQRVGKKYSWDDIHKMLFPDGPPKRRSLRELKKARETYILERHALGRY